MKTLFAKYNRERLPKFQTVTKIVELNDETKKAIKQALMPEAQQHIAEIYANYARLIAKYPQIKLVPPTLEDANTVTFPMAQGVSLESLLKQALDKQDRSALFVLLDKFIAYVDGFVTERQVKFVPSEKFKQVFGEWTLDEPQDLIELANVDMIFSNLFVANDDSITQIDYEWVFECAVPKEFVLWRAFNVFAYFMSLHIYKFTSLLEVFENYHVTNYDNQQWLSMDLSWQTYIRGKNTPYMFKDTMLQKQLYISDKEQRVPNSSGKFPENSHMQLFYYQNDEINVPDVRTQYFEDDCQTRFSFDFANLENLTHIRIDLTNFPVVANLEYVKVILEDGSEHLVQPCYSNANLVEGNSYTYLHNDPINVYYLTPLNFAQIARVEIAVDLQPIKRSEMLELANQITTKQTEKIIQLESICQQTQQQLQQAEQQAHQLNPWNHAVVALHYDIGQDFNAEHYLQQAAKVGLKHYEFSLSEIAGIEGVRLDPLNLPAHIKLISAQIVTKDGVFYPLSVAWHNANHLAENCYSFYHDDPIWIFDWSSLGALDYDKIVFEFESALIDVHELSNFVVQQLAVFNTKEAELSSIQAELSSIQAELSSTQTELSSTQTELSSTQTELSGVYNSRSWKITKPLRKLAKIK